MADQALPAYEVLLKVSRGGGPRRLDRALLEELRAQTPALTRSQLKPWFHEKKIWLDDRPRSPSHELAPGTYRVRIFGWNPGDALGQRAQPAPEGCFLPVVFEDERLLVLNKSSGTPSVPHSAGETHTATNAALAHFAALAGIGRGGLEPGILHRLDNSTSGLIAFAKTQDAYRFFHAYWRARGVRKTYRALTSAPPLPGWRKLPALLSAPIAHDAKSARRMRVLEGAGASRPIRGRELEARTWIERVTPVTGGFDFTVSIETGVMHQIRAHLAHAGIPLLGDTLYGGEPSTRIWLHAWRLEIPLPDGPILALEAALPEGWPSKP